MKRTIGLTFAAVAAAAVLAGCGSSDSDSSDASTSAAADSSAMESSAAESSVEASTSGTTVVKVDGKNVEGLDLKSVNCVKHDKNINIGSAAINGKDGLGVVMSEGDPPKVVSLGVVVDGSALAVTPPSVGSAKVEADGDKYTITGKAVGADMKNPTAGMIEKKFEIVVECK